MNSIRQKITVCLMATVLIALAAVGSSCIALSYRSTIATVDQMRVRLLYWLQNVSSRN